MGFWASTPDVVTLRRILPMKPIEAGGPRRGLEPDHAPREQAMPAGLAPPRRPTTSRHDVVPLWPPVHSSPLRPTPAHLDQPTCMSPRA